MAVEMKYVVVTSEAFGEQMFIFPKSINHDAFAENLSHIRYEDGMGWKRVFQKPVSAGFVLGKHCYGKSESLGISSRPVLDDELLERGGK